MDIVRSIFDFILSLLGHSTNKPAIAKKGRASAAGSVQGLDELQGAEHVQIAAGAVQIQRDGAALIRDDDDGRLVWIDQVNKAMPRARYKDVWGPVSGATDDGLVEFCTHEHAYNMEIMGDPRAAERKLQSFGYQDCGHFWRVRATILKHFGTPTGPRLGDCVLSSQRYMSATMKAQRALLTANQDAAVKANPALTAPIHGITIEKYAQIVAKTAAGMSKKDTAALLASENLDQATFEKVNAGWTDRMAKDPSFALMGIYSKAMQGAGQGAQGAAGASFAAVGYGGAAASGPEPMPLEKVIDIQGAMSAWSKSGQDVNANLQKKFGMTAMDWSNVSSWWMSHLIQDMNRYARYNDEIEEAEKRWMAGTPARPDSDLQF